MKMITYSVTVGFADDSSPQEVRRVADRMADIAMASRGVLHVDHSDGERHCVICGKSGVAVVSEDDSQLGVCVGCINRLARLADGRRGA